MTQWLKGKTVLADRYAGRNELPEIVMNLMLREALAPEDEAKAVCEAWSLAEYPERTLGVQRWRWLWERVGFSEEGRRVEGPAQPLYLYRGCTERSMRGMAWTGNLERAEWFAERRRLFGSPGIVVVATVEPRRLYAHLTDRSDDEWVIDTRRLTMNLHKVPTMT